jgi:hypothetical protein
MNQSFADTIGSITVTGNLVRIDFVSMAAAQPADAKAQRRFEVTERVVLPLDGFLRGMAAQQDIINKMLEAGILKSKPAADAADDKPAKGGKGGK